MPTRAGKRTLEGSSNTTLAGLRSAKDFLTRHKVNQGAAIGELNKEEGELLNTIAAQTARIDLLLAAHHAGTGRLSGPHASGGTGGGPPSGQDDEYQRLIAARRQAHDDVGEVQAKRATIERAMTARDEELDRLVRAQMGADPQDGIPQPVSLENTRVHATHDEFRTTVRRDDFGGGAPAGGDLRGFSGVHCGMDSGQPKRQRRDTTGADIAPPLLTRRESSDYSFPASCPVSPPVVGAGSSPGMVWGAWGAVERPSAASAARGRVQPPLTAGQGSQVPPSAPTAQP